ncbi:glycine dehydrogenase [Nonlabens ulvanivorans]|uniref:Glycine dehydrogenase n=1 Tax=Nonlabens ulvanivorans TaxID=906888 RepID=A0A090X3U2_NONUL|nr:glycine dehydrogenase [Nonlabens ulvanivorans]
MNTDRFALRHIGPRKADLAPMLETIGVESIDQLVYETVPENIRLKQDLQLDTAMSEYEFLSHIKKLGDKNKQFRSYIGLGYNAPITPAVIQRNILENPGWYTAYTPYQAEIAQASRSFT